MSDLALIGVSLGGLLVAALAAAGTKVLHNFSRHELEAYCRVRRRRERYAEILGSHDRATLAAESLEILATVVFVLAGGLWLFRESGGGFVAAPLALLAAIAVTSLVLLSVHLWIPWAIVRVWSAPFLFHTWWLWRIVSRLFWPLTVGVRIVDALARRLANQPEEPDNEEEAFEDEIRSIVTAGMRDGLLEADAGEMIEGVIELGDADVSDVMTPRSEVDAIDVELSWEEVQKYVIEVGRTRIPVYEDSLDNVIGVLFVKDLLPELSKPAGEPHRDLRAILRDAWSVPETKRLDELLQEFLRTRNHLAIVRDEYQALAGVVTIEDVLEEIVGEIVDEWDEEEIDGIDMVSESIAEVMGRVHLDELNERLGVDLPESDDFDTIAGYIVDHLGRIPKPGEEVTSGNVRLTILAATRRRVERLRVELLGDTQREIA